MALFSLYALFAPSEPGGFTFPQMDKVVHLAIFLSLAATSRWHWGRSWVVVALVAAYAPVSEVIQSQIGRDGNAFDALADLTGVTLGWLGASRLLRRTPSAASDR